MTTGYTPEFEARIRAWAEQQLDSERLAHVRGVVETAHQLAERYAPDQIARVRLAGWIHDVAKHWPDSALLEYAQTHNLPVTEIERQVPMLLHGVVAYHLAAEHFGLDDPLLRTACACHTTAAPAMTVTDKIVFLADLIEPNRDLRKVDLARAEAKRDLDSAVLLVVDLILRHLIRKGRFIDTRAILLRNKLLAAGVRYSKE